MHINRKQLTMVLISLVTLLIFGIFLSYYFGYLSDAAGPQASKISRDSRSIVLGAATIISGALVYLYWRGHDISARICLLVLPFSLPFLYDIEAFEYSVPQGIWIPFAMALAITNLRWAFATLVLSIILVAVVYPTAYHAYTIATSGASLIIALMLITSKLIQNCIARDALDAQAMAEHAEAITMDSELKYRTLFETANDGIFLQDATGFLDCNQKGADMYGLSKDAVIGKTPTDFTPERQPDGRLSAEVSAQKIAAVMAGEAQRFEWQSLRADGVPFDVEITLNQVEYRSTLCLQAIVRDITERKQAEIKLKLAANVFTHACEGIIITDASGNIVEVNDTFTNITGYSRDEVLGKKPSILQSGRHGSEFYEAMWKAMLEKGHWYGEIWNRCKSGEVYAELVTISAVRDASGTTQNYVALFTDITQIKEHQLQLEHIANYDALTGLPNRLLLADRLQQAMSQSERRGQSLAVVYLDLDGFKAVNDNYGHQLGDKLLIAVSQRMKDALREGDSLARIGGDEFIAIVVDLEQISSCESVLERLLNAASASVTLGDAAVQVSASLGVTFYPHDMVDADQLVRHADNAMYIAKQMGKNRYHVFDVAYDAAVQSQHEIIDNIRHALDRHEFVLFYQPKVDMTTSDIIGVEALIRWQHPERGLLQPADFLPIINDHPLGIEIGEWVIYTALKQIADWHTIGLDIPVSVNIGALQLQQDNFLDRLKMLLAAHPQVRPDHLELEILETNSLQDVTKISKLMRECRQMGVRFALDDFGTGYSSLTYLRNLPADTLKIDKSFICNMLDNPDDFAIVQGIIGLASAFQREVIAEGVETIEHRHLLLSMGCKLAQGYGIAYPTPAEEFQNWRENWRENSKDWRNQ